MTKTTKLFWTLVALGLFLEARAVDAAQAPNQDMVDTKRIAEILDDCSLEAEGGTHIPFIGDAPFIGSMINGAADSMLGGPKKRRMKQARCVETRMEAIRAENEREAERRNDTLDTRCTIEAFRCGSKDNRRACGDHWGVDNVCPDLSQGSIAPANTPATATSRTPVKPDEDGHQQREVASAPIPLDLAPADSNDPCRSLANLDQCPPSAQEPFRCREGVVIRDEYQECTWECNKGCSWVPVA